MRWMIAVMVALSATSAFAGGWGSYVNARFGYETAVPPGFACAPESDNGDGRACRSQDGKAKLTVWGGYVNVTDDSGFAGEVGRALAGDKARGWTMTYQASTPGWASYSGTRGQSVLYVRMIGGCKDTQFASFAFEYPATEINAMKPLVERLVKSLRQQMCP
jgi:hypothetical protein